MILSAILLLLGLLIKGFWNTSKQEFLSRNGKLTSEEYLSIAILPFASFYLLLTVSDYYHELPFLNILIVYYVLMAMVLVLMLLYADAKPKFRLLSRANTIMLFCIGVLGTLADLNNLYSVIYLWIAVLILSVYMYLETKKRPWLISLSLVAAFAIHITVNYLFPEIRVVEAYCICGSIYAVLVVVFLLSNYIAKKRIPFYNDIMMIVTILLHFCMLLCTLFWIEGPSGSMLIGAMLLVMVLVCQWSLYQKKHNLSGIVSLLVFFPVINRLADYAVFDTTMKMLLWIIIFGAFLLLGRLLYPSSMITVKREDEEHCLLIDWVGFGSIIALSMMVQPGEEEWIFVAEMLLSGFFLNLIKRVPEKLEKGIYTVALAIVCLALATQPFITIPSLFSTEYVLLFVVLFGFVMQKLIWKNQVPFIFVSALISVVIQAFGCIIHEEIWDLLLLSLILLAILILSFWIQSKRWFALSGITLVTIALYCTRGFWKSLSWWIYLLGAGVILIVIAVIKEYQRRNLDKEDSKFYQVKAYWDEWKV